MISLSVQELLSSMYPICLFLPLLFVLWGWYPQSHVLELFPVFGFSVLQAASDPSLPNSSSIFRGKRYSITCTLIQDVLSALPYAQLSRGSPNQAFFSQVLYLLSLCLIPSLLFSSRLTIFSFLERVHNVWEKNVLESNVFNKLSSHMYLDVLLRTGNAFGLWKHSFTVVSIWMLLTPYFC